MGLVTGAILAGAGMGMQAYSMYQQQQGYKLQGKMAEIQGQAEQTALNDAADRMAQEHRELQAEQRLSFADSGIGQEQPLLVMADQIGKMVADQSELRRRGIVARTGAKAQSLLSKMEARQQLMAEAGSLLGQAYSTGSTLYGMSSTGTKPTGYSQLKKSKTMYGDESQSFY